MSAQNCKACGKKLTFWNHGEQKGICFLCEETRLGTSPWPAKGVLWWMAFIGFNVVQGLYGAFQNGSDFYRVALLILGGAMSLAVCAWWYDISKRRKRRAWLLRVLGYFVFAIGSMGPISAILAALLPIVAGKQTPSNFALLLLVVSYLFSLAVVAAFITGAFFLVFRPETLKAALSSESAGTPPVASTKP